MNKAKKHLSMGRILGIDFGQKRTGLAVTDPLKIIATALDTIETKFLVDYLKKYIQNENVELIVLGLPVGLNAQETDNTTAVKAFAEILTQQFPSVPLVFTDERFTSKMAVRSMIDSGMKKKDRRVKGNIDKISAVLILQSYLSSTF
jgi:putative holliday junction resolvase